MAKRPSIEEVDAQLAARSKRVSRGRLGAFALHAKYDARETTRGAYEARMRRYELEVDPDGELKRRDPQALARKVQAALNRDMEKVRLARATKKANAAEEAARKAARQRAAVEEQIRRTPSDDMPMLAALLLARLAVSEQPF